MTPTDDTLGTVILVTHDGMGSATAPLQHQLLKTYLALLLENGMTPDAICFYTEGVKMTIAESPVLQELRALAARGTHLIVCQTCLNYYAIADQRAVGIVGGMADILEAQWRAKKVITI
jgi:hypothetical protein